MKILHIIYCMGIGGAQTMLVDIMNEQVKNDEVHLVVINSFYNNDLLKDISSDIKIHRIERKQGSRNPIDIIHLNLLLWKLKPNIVHAHDSSIVKLLFLRKIPICLTVHDTGLDSRYYNKYNAIIAISKAVNEDIKLRSDYDSVIIPNGICTDKILKRDRIIKKNKYKIVQVSRLALPKKGQDILIEAIKLLNDKGYKNICLDLIGRGKSESELKTLVKRLSVEDVVSFLGLKSRGYIYQHLCDYDLFVQPSRNEGFGLTVAEAIAAKVPVLVSNIEGPMEIIENGKYGFYFSSGSIEECAQMIEKKYLNKVSIDTSLALKHIKEMYDISVTVNRYRNVYNQIV